MENAKIQKTEFWSQIFSFATSTHFNGKYIVSITLKVSITFSSYTEPKSMITITYSLDRRLKGFSDWISNTQNLILSRGMEGILRENH